MTKEKKKVLLVFGAALVLRLWLIFAPSHGDLLNHADWGIRFWEYGPKRFYMPETYIWSYSWPNQPPGTIYLFGLIRKLYEAIYQFFWQINLAVPVFPSQLMFFIESRLYPALLKLPSSLADLGLGWLIYWFLKKRKPELAFKISALWLFNPISFYNSSVWGQTDAWVSFFGLASILLLISCKPILACLALAASVYFKASLVILAPLVFLVLVRQKHSWSKILTSILVPLALAVILSLPFVYKGNPLVWLFNLYREKVFGWQLHEINVNAFNFWGLAFGLEKESDNFFFGPLTYRGWGVALFSLVYLLILAVVYQKPSEKRIIFASFLIIFSAFMILTSIHERYLFPAFPFLAILIGFYPRLTSFYYLFSGLHLANLYNFWWYPRFEFLVNLFAGRKKLFCRFLALVNIFLFCSSWRFFFTWFGLPVKINRKRKKRWLD